MNYNFKQSAPSVLLFLGYILYFVLLFKSTFSFSIIWMILLIYVWVISSLFFNKYSLNSFLCVFSLSGFLVSLSVFFLKGVEEVPFPEGAIIFHLDGIALSLLILFICSLPMILKINPNNIDNEKRHLKTNQAHGESFEIADNGNKSEEWEEATEEDLESGNFETI